VWTYERLLDGDPQSHPAPHRHSPSQAQARAAGSGFAGVSHTQVAGVHSHWAAQAALQGLVFASVIGTSWGFRLQMTETYAGPPGGT
jgi:hypothetical protein